MSGSRSKSALWLWRAVLKLALLVLAFIALAVALGSTRNVGQDNPTFLEPYAQASNIPAVGPTPTPLQCPTCWFLSQISAYFDQVVPPALPQGWLATNALGPPPQWVTSNSGVPMPPADTLPNAAYIDDPAVVSDKRLDSFQFYQPSPELPSVTTLTSKHRTWIRIWALTAACWRSAPTVEILSRTSLTRAEPSLWAVITAQSAPIGVARLRVVRLGAATPMASSPRWWM